MQFNQYHKYTVDEHSLLAVAKCEALSQEPGILGDVYREIRERIYCTWRSCFTILARDERKTTARSADPLRKKRPRGLVLMNRRPGRSCFLVHRHLLMAHTAFRRDPYDDKVMLPFAREMGTPEVLRKFLALTAADIAAVGPGVLTKWKESLLIELYLRTLPQVSGEREQATGPQQFEQVAKDLVQDRMLAALGVEPDWIESQLKQFPLRLFTRHAAEPDSGASGRREDD